ncbi:hypothetical protein [Tychonema sp. LEGE 07203]|uniref:hypothetical protein n=1 Tax=Tychonema sp. LEGE 07203 TaxID=1828671 RepID=UPI001881AD32|nr:hypothetical protein [Tychonema sp. LEGE 07203]MBE9096046.1 hypothetical protein [Tychonema sp. LEGE 07203]
MNYWGQAYGKNITATDVIADNHLLLASNQFCSSCHHTIGQTPTIDLKYEFVAATKKEIASQQHLPERLKLQLSYGFPPVECKICRPIIGQILLRHIGLVLRRLEMIVSLF